MSLKERGGVVVDLISRIKPDKKLYIPHFHAPSFVDIDFKYLHEELGVKYLVMDFENTIGKTGENIVHPEIAGFLKEIVEKGYVEKEFCIATNANREELRELADNEGWKIKMKSRGSKKPDKEFFDEIIRDIGCLPTEAVMVGDKMSRDILGARRAGMWTVLVEPLHKPETVDIYTGVRAAEKYCLWQLRRVIGGNPRKKTS
jgi:uncharacterized protein